jgi:hypothetical protein
MATFKIILDRLPGVGVEITSHWRFLSMRGFRSAADARAWIGEQQIAEQRASDAAASVCVFRLATLADRIRRSIDRASTPRSLAER